MHKLLLGASALAFGLALGGGAMAQDINTSIGPTSQGSGSANNDSASVLSGNTSTKTSSNSQGAGSANNDGLSALSGNTDSGSNSQ
ncbi:MAG: hypothetical protein JO127_01815, partial [Caulobacteraceae bacterium]|nr:hypothetical protein [Caulobacteraceae bacterium]